MRQALRLERIHLLGHSWGGWLAVEYMMTKPVGVVSLVMASSCFSTAQYLAEVTRLVENLPADVRTVLRQHEQAGTTDSPAYQQAVEEFNRRHLCRIQPYPEPMQRVGAGIGVAVYQTMQGPNEFTLTGNLKEWERGERAHEIVLPTLFTCGRYDEVTPVCVQQSQRLVAGAEMVIFEQSAHVAHLEETERYLQVVRDFLRRAERLDASAMAQDDQPATNPSLALYDMLGGSMVVSHISLAARFDLADHIAGGIHDAGELAKVVGADPNSFYRFLRALVTLGLLEEAEGRRFLLTPVGACLQKNAPDSMHAMARWAEIEDELGWRHLEACVRTGKTSFELVHGMGMFDYFQRNPDVSALFDAAMTGFVSRNRDAIVDAYSFEPAQKIVDVGGGVGSLMANLLSANPGTTGVIYDLPGVVESAKKQIENAGLVDRCECIAGDFFAAAPAGGDAYLLVSILHDWDDERCLAILKNCRRAMPKEARLLVVEMVMPPDTAPSFVKLFDVVMLVLTGGRERTQAEFEQLLSAAGFRLNRVLPTASTVSIIEAAPA